MGQLMNKDLHAKTDQFIALLHKVQEQAPNDKEIQHAATFYEALVKDSGLEAAQEFLNSIRKIASCQEQANRSINHESSLSDIVKKLPDSAKKVLRDLSTTITSQEKKYFQMTRRQWLGNAGILISTPLILKSKERDFHKSVLDREIFGPSPVERRYHTEKYHKYTTLNLIGIAAALTGAYISLGNWLFTDIGTIEKSPELSDDVISVLVGTGSFIHALARMERQDQSPRKHGGR